MNSVASVCDSKGEIKVRRLLLNKRIWKVYDKVSRMVKRKSPCNNGWENGKIRGFSLRVYFLALQNLVL